MKVNKLTYMKTYVYVLVLSVFNCFLNVLNMNITSHMKNMLDLFLWCCDFKHGHMSQEFATFSFFTIKSQHMVKYKRYTQVSS